jgi:hypothetical protein
MRRQDDGAAQMRETTSFGASIHFVFARPTKSLQFVGTAVERMRRVPDHVHRGSTTRTSRPVMCTKPDLHKHGPKPQRGPRVFAGTTLCLVP